jgi:signal transduction histidine kinase
MRRLHLQFYLAFLAALAVFVIASVLFWHAMSPTRADEWGLAAAEQLAPALLPAADLEPDERQRLLDELARRIDADLALYDAAGNRIAVSGDVPTLPQRQILKASGRIMTRRGPMLIIALDDGRRLAMHPLHHAHSHGPQLLILPISLVLALAIGAYPIARRLTLRLSRLQKGVEQLGGGDLAVRVRVEGRDEVAALARSFNEAAARIEELLRSHKMLLANCSHELRTPLARIRLGIERLSAHAEPALQEELKRSITELDTLIGEMLLASRLDTLQRTERSEALDLLALTAEEAAHFDCEVEGESVTVRGDPTLLRRMVRNLLENAERHAGGATRLAVARAGSDGVLIIEDRGPGIQQADHEKIFEPFYSSPRGAGARGAGLGLSIVRQIARAHGGNVSYAPREEGGSRFTVTLPKNLDHPS